MSVAHSALPSSVTAHSPDVPDASPAPSTSQSPVRPARLLSGLSLRRQLLLWLLLPQLVLWLAGSVLAWRVALDYANKGLDQSLTQSVRGSKTNAQKITAFKAIT